MPGSIVVANQAVAPKAIDAVDVGKYLLDAACAGELELTADSRKAGVDIETRSAKGHATLKLAAYNARLDVRVQTLVQ